jgi:anti-sigma-K factor RskA
MPDDHVSDTLPAYALGILEAEEATAIAAHLARCPVCQEELAGFQQTTADLSAAVRQVAPPDHLKTKLRRALAADATEGATAQPLRSAAPKAAAPTAARKAARGSWQHNVRAWLSGPAWRPLALALLAMIALTLLISPREASAPGVDAITMVGTEAAPDAYAVVVLGSHYDRTIGTLIVDHLEPLGAGQQYQLWLSNGERISGGVFDVGEDGYGSMTIRAPEDLDTYRFGVTIEPAGGSPGPTGERVLASAP